MMQPKMHLFFFLTVFSMSAMAQESEIIRLRGFAEHQKQDKQFDKARRSGEKAFLEEEDQWESARRKAASEYKKQAKRSEMPDDGPEAKADEREKLAQAREYQKLQEAYAKSHKEFDRANYPDLVSEATELGLNQERPRYDFQKRMAGNKPGGSSSSSSGGSSSGRFGGGNRNNGSSFPPPPTSFDDFGDGGYAAPNPEDYGDVPPPPPPPFPSDDFPGGGFNDDGYIPPPPPPPFDGEIETQF